MLNFILATELKKEYVYILTNKILVLMPFR